MLNEFAPTGVLQALPRQAGNGWTGSKRLQTSALAAATDRTVDQNSLVAHFTRQVICAMVELAVQDEASADAGAHCEESHIGGTLARAEFPFGESGSVGIVF